MGVARPPLLLVVAGGMLAGDLAGGIEVAPVAALAALASAMLLILLPWRRARQLRTTVALALAAFGLACAAADKVYNPGLPPDHVARLPLPARARVSGTLIAAPERRGATERFHLEVDEIDSGDGGVGASGVVLVYVRETQRDWRAGDRLRASVPLRRPRNFGNPGEFDFAGYLARRGVYVTAFAADDSAFEALGGVSPPVGAALHRWRRGLRRLFSEALSAETASVLRALIIGDAAGLPEDLQQAFGRSGVRHVLTISGLHVSMVAAAGYGAIRWLLARSSWLLLAANVPKLAAALSIVPVVVYAGLAGGSLPTTRAVAMGLVFLGAAVVDRRRHLLVGLGLAAVIVMAGAPGSSREISFQLSFAAVLGLVLALDRFWPWWLAAEERRLVRLRGGGVKLWRYVAVYCAVSCGALAATLPLTAFHFNQVSLMALLANAVVVPLLGTAAVALGLVAAVVYLFLPALATLFVWLAGIAVYLGVEAVRFFAALPYAMVRVVTPTEVELVLVYGALLAAVCLRGRRRVAALALVALCVCVDVVWWYGERLHPNELRITFLSVGQGDSAVVELPGGEVMVVDGGGQGGGTFDVGERVVAPFLWSRRIASIDRLVVTHPQYDHYGGLGYLAENFAPREFWSSGALSTSVSYAKLLASVRRNGIGEREVRSGERLRVGGASVRVDFPPAESEGFGVNDRSLVLSLFYGGVRILLTGDIEALAEGLLVRTAPGLCSAVVKVPHHGSASSSTPSFVRAVRPRLAVVSAGYDNRYGFPSARVLGRYAAQSSAILRTDLDGAVEIRVDSSGSLRARARASREWLTLGGFAECSPEANPRNQIDTHVDSGISEKGDA